MVWMLVCVMGFLPLAAQEEFNPENPPEPNALYRVTVSMTPDDAGYVSGTGKYQKGASVNIRTSAKNGFKFKHWLKNGEVYSTNTLIRYTMEAENVEFRAVYEFDPTSPEEPSEKLRYPLWLDCTPKGACSFNHSSGTRMLAGQYAYIDAYASQGFEFQGWYDESGNKVGSSQYLSFQMPYKETKLTARFVFNPGSPGDPSGGNQDDVDNEPKTEAELANDAAYIKLSAQISAVQTALNNAKNTLNAECQDVAAQFADRIAAIQSGIDALSTDLKTKYDNVKLTAESTVDTAGISASIEKLVSDAKAAQKEFEEQASTGDVNGDGRINIQDVVVAVDAVGTGTYNTAIDVNGDGKVNIQDVVVIVNLSLQ